MRIRGETWRQTGRQIVAAAVGAVFAATLTAATNAPALWSLQPIREVAPPSVQKSGWVRNGVDAFILARLEREGLTPSPEAERSALLRRVHLDLTGLPPTPKELAAYLADPSGDAYERVVDQLLASPHYGERWARWWLDVARYADSNGYSFDAPRSMWPWRNWVIEAFNRDQPFDTFVIEQLAGDLLPESTLQQRVATGFHRNTQINEEGGIDPEQFRIESVLDRVNTTGTALLGLSVGCAQCHDHKYDPISQREYFQLYAFFNQQNEPTLEVPGLPANESEVKSRRREAEAEFDRYWGTLGGKIREWEAGLTPAGSDALPGEVRDALAVAPEKRSRSQKRRLYQASGLADAGYQQREQRLADAEAGRGIWATTLVLAERPEPRTNCVFIKGDFTRPGAAVTAGTPAALPPLPATPGRPPNRLDLARWLMDPRHPLTARVVVNRVWQQYFGRGLVETENDFGTQGTPPTHPELLDWLARGFQAGQGSRGAAPAPSAWRLKALHRLIVTSATYRQSSWVRPELASIDPLNRLKARQSRLRLDAEVIRDAALVASGRLVENVGGPSVFPPQPEGVTTVGQVKREWIPSTGADRFRRGLYTWLWRATPHPLLAVFDAPEGFTTCTRRLRSNTPLQALTLLNDAGFVELAGALADRIQREAPPAERLNYACQLCLGRPPRPAERSRLEALWTAEQKAADERTAWFSLARVLLNLDETITRE